MSKLTLLSIGFGALTVVLAGCGLTGGKVVTVPESSTSGDPNAAGERELRMITLLPRDGIPAVDNPRFISAEEADLSYEDDELVIGVDFNGDVRAYSIPFLSRHEIVNDTVGGVKLAVTW